MERHHHEIETLLAYLHGQLATEELVAIEQRLLEDESLRKALLELSVEEIALADWAKTELLTVELDNQTFGSDALAATEAAELQTEKLGGWHHQLTQNWRWWAAAAVLVVCVSGAPWLNRQKDTIVVPSGAHLIASVDAKWKGTAPALNAPMAIGDYKLESGSIDLNFTSGANVTVSGPARFVLKSDHHVHLESGNLVARIPDEALGFIVTSPETEVVDLGTEFGLSVSGDGHTDVHVLDGLVEVLSRDRDVVAPTVMIAKGRARRFHGHGSTDSGEIPVSSRESLVGDKRHTDLGVQMLRGSVRIAKQLTADDLSKNPKDGNWIDLIAEQQGVTLAAAIKVTIDSPGSYRSFGDISETIPAGTRLNSYLLHFRPGSKEQVRGVIRFDRPVVGVLCTGFHLRKSDPIFGIPSVQYPTEPGPRGMEPGRFDGDIDYLPDEVILSQDRTALCVNAYGNPESGYDQVRVLTLARNQE